MIIAWVNSHRRSALLIALTLCLPVYLLTSTLVSILSVRADYVDQIASLEPRLARVNGLVAKEQALAEALSGVNSTFSDHIYPSGSDAAAVAAAIQAETRRIFADSGLRVTNSQVLATRNREVFDYVSVKIVAQGSLGALDDSLMELSRFRPVILVETLDVFPNRPRRKNQEEAQSVTMTLQLLSLRAVQ